MALPIEDYALIGDTRTAALVGRDGSVDWLCFPRFDSAACFAALLGDRDNGRWLMGPDPDATVVECTRRYVEDSTVLESTFRTATGTVRITDLMPIGDDCADLVRCVEGVEGSVRIRHEWVVRFDYGKVRPWVTRHGEGATTFITAVAGPDRLILRGPRMPTPEDGRHVDVFDIHEGDSMVFSCTWTPSHEQVPDPLDLDSTIDHTLRSTQEWASHLAYEGPYRAQVLRSLTTLRLLTHGATGGIVAAATTSLPECLGGSRNWDYRYSWLRDAAMTIGSLLRAGYRHEVQPWRDWLMRAVAGDPEDLQIMYAVDGARRLPERELDHLAGYADSRPVRIGNAAVCQWQNDVLGEVMAALDLARAEAGADGEDSWALQRALVDDLARRWQRPDRGLWEVRGENREFTHSRVLVWAAFSLAVRAVEQHGFEGDVETWRRLRDAVRAEVLERGVDRERMTFVQHYDTREVDASLLVLPRLGFIAGDDPLMLGTIAAIEEDLTQDGLLLRYRVETGVDGIDCPEHPFLACSFWLVSAYAGAGRVGDAERLMDRLVGLCNDVGLLSEEYDTGAGRMLGNFPQAYSHLTLVAAAIDIEEARGASHRDPDGGEGSGG